NSADGICNGIIELIEDYGACLNNAAILKEQINNQWRETFDGFRKQIGQISGTPTGRPHEI
ncbi:MAG: hypothetical protein ACOC90_02880, partial [Bacteroidota bacterium]